MNAYTNTPTPQSKNRIKTNGNISSLHRDPSKAMQQMMESIDRLRSVYEAETEALKRSDTQGFLALQDEKMSSAMSYEAGINEIIARKDEMKDVDPQMKRKLRQMQKDFAELSQQNMDALQRMQRTMERLGGKIRTAAKDAAKKNRVFSYGQNGQIADVTHKRISISVQEEA
jgi:hypothetical protein